VRQGWETTSGPWCSRGWSGHRDQGASSKRSASTPSRDGDGRQGTPTPPSTFARRAIAADTTWPYGYITLAWYGLVTGKFDPLPILREAVRVSPGAREEIRTNADFARFPELMAVLEGSG